MYKRQGLVRIDGKRPGGLTLIPWQGGKPLTLDVTVVSTLADSYLYIPRFTLPAALLKPLQSGRNVSTLPFLLIIYSDRSQLRPLAPQLLSEVGRRSTYLSGDSRDTSFLFQRLSMLIQRFNSALIMDSFCFSDEDPDL